MRPEVGEGASAASSHVLGSESHLKEQESFLEEKPSASGLPSGSTEFTFTLFRFIPHPSRQSLLPNHEDPSPSLSWAGFLCLAPPVCSSAPKKEGQGSIRERDAQHSPLADGSPTTHPPVPAHLIQVSA